MISREKFKEYVDSCVTFIITHTVWAILLAIGGFLVANVPKMTTFILPMPAWFNTLTTILSAISIFILILFSVWYAHVKKSRFETKTTDKENEINLADEHLPEENFGNSIMRREIEDSFQEKVLDQIMFKKITIEMQIKSNTEIEYTQVFKGVVNCDDLQPFEKELVWSGSQYKRSELVKSSVEADFKDNIGDRISSPYMWRLRFTEDISKNDPISFTIKTYVADDEKKMLPHSSFCVKYPVDELILELSVPKGMVHSIRGKCYRDAGRQAPVWTSKAIKKTEIGDLEKYTFSKSAPSYWHYYVLEWKFTEKYKQL